MLDNAKVRKVVFVAGVFVVGTALGIVLNRWLIRLPGQYASTSEPLRLDQGTLTHHLIACDNQNSYRLEAYRSLNQQLNSIVDEAVNSQKAQNISIYFREMDSGTWAGINENEDYIPASLVKVPLMIAYLKIAESDHKLLADAVTFAGSNGKNDNQVVNVPATSLQAGHSYTIEQLIDAMIFYSANDAYSLLYTLIRKDYLEKIYTDLGLEYIPSSPNIRTMTAKSFSLFFRVLYNASYLSTDMSEKALRLLTKSTYKDGIVAGVPRNVTVAHKFGERTVLNNRTLQYRELHDCGIVYYSKDPYFLCVMTRGTDFAKLQQIIQDISSAVFRAVQKES